MLGGGATIATAFAIRLGVGELMGEAEGLR